MTDLVQVSIEDIEQAAGLVTDSRPRLRRIRRRLSAREIAARV